MRAYFLAAASLAIAAIACGDDETNDHGHGSTTASSSTGPGPGGGGAGGSATGGGGASSTGGGGSSCTSTAAFALTSPNFADMDLLPVQYKCGSFNGGLNISPPLEWTPGPDGTLSYAIIFRDLTGAEFLHSAIWDVPGCVFALPEDVEQSANPTDVAGAKQCRAYNGQFGYAGPCAPQDPNPRTYQFEAFAINAETLPGVTTDSTLAQVEAAMESNSLASSTLTVIEDDP